MEALAKNAALKATIASLKGSDAGAPAAASESEVQKKAKIKMEMIANQEVIFRMQQTIDTLEMEAKHKMEEAKDLRAKMKTVEADVDALRNSGAAVWESTGISTITYRDPFHTGVSKRTPTGGYFTS